MDKCCKVAALYIATLKAMVLIHQGNHWVTKGENFYGSHLLFEKIYQSASENLDSAAEKFVGLFGDECLSYALQAEFLNKVLLKYNNLSDSPFAASIAVEKDFLKFSQDAYNCFEEEGRLSLGLDDLILSIANEREEAIYHLKQSMKST